MRWIELKDSECLEMATISAGFQPPNFANRRNNLRREGKTEPIRA